MKKKGINIKKKKLFFLTLVILGVFLFILSLQVHKSIKQYKIQVSNSSKFGQSEFAQALIEDNDIDISNDVNVSSQYIDTSEYTDEYKAYLNMSEEERKKLAVIPNKYKVKMELLDNDYIKSLYKEEKKKNNRNNVF